MTSQIVQLLSDQHNPNLDIVDQILCNIGVAGIFALHATCRRLRWLIRYMTSSPYLLNINKHLETFSNDPTRFRYELGKRDGLITGSFVRNFLTFSTPASPVLVVYFDSRDKSAEFMKYLQKDEGYGDDIGEQDVYSTTHKTHSDAEIVIETIGSPIVEIINNAQTSADLVFISWNKAYCLFPLPTIKRHKFFALSPFDDIMGIALREYADDGWTTRDLVWPNEAPELFPQEAVRQIGGKGSLIIDLGNSPRGEFTPDYVLENGTFSIDWTVDNLYKQPRLAVEAATLLFNARALRYGHTIGCLGRASDSWKHFLTKKLRHWAYLEVLKMDPSTRPVCFALDSEYRCLDRAKSSTWDFADDHISTWFREWRKQETVMAMLPPAPDYRLGVKRRPFRS